MAITVALLPACDQITDIDTRGYDPIPPLNALNQAAITPIAAVRYWELRTPRMICAGNDCSQRRDSVLLAGGSVARSQLDGGTLTALDAIQPQNGFAYGCPPGVCFLYMAAVLQNGVTAYTTTESLRQFLGTVETAEEAALLVRAQDYYWEYGQTGVTGIKPVANGWEFIVLKLVKDCAPVQTDRFLLLVKRDGSVRQLARDVWQKHENACI